MAQSAVELHPRAAGTGRVPPHNLEAEESLLGAMLLSRDAIATAVEAVHTDDFYKPAHAHIFDAILALYGSGEPVDPVTVAEELRRSGLLEAIGGKSSILQIQGATPTTANAGHYAKIVEELSLLRRLIAVAGEISDMGYDLPDDVTETLDRAEALVFAVAQRRVADTLVGIHDVLQQSLDQLEALYDRDSVLLGVPTGYADLDDLLLGLQRSTLVVVAARPSMGKTSFALGAARHVAVDARRPVIFFSLEMGHLELTQRLLAAEARVDSKKLQTGRLGDADWGRIVHGVGRLSEAPLYIDDNPHCTVMEMRAKARRIKARTNDLGLIVVDYLQLMSNPHGRNESRQVEVSEMSRGLKILARELETPVMALSQLNRSPEQRNDKRPMLADLRESGCLTAATRIQRADTGATVSLGRLLASGERNIPVWTVDDDYRLVRGVMTHVFPSGVKPVYRLRLRSGMEVEASPNHPFLTFDGWRRLDELAVGERLAVPRRIPEPEHPTEWSDEQTVLLAHLIASGRFDSDGPVSYLSADARHLAAVERAAEAMGSVARRVALGSHQRLDLHPDPGSGGEGLADWLDRLRLLGHSPDKVTLPDAVLGLPRARLALFLRHLWAAGGRMLPGRALPALSYAAPGHDLAQSLQLVLFRFGVLSRTRVVEHPSGAVAHELRVAAERSRRRFLAEIGLPWPATGTGSRLAIDLVGDQVMAAPRTRAYRSTMGETYYAGTPAESGSAAAQVQAMVDDDESNGLTQTDLCWDAVERLDFLGETPVFDATVPGTHNFLANGMVVHNSIEQDADVVAFIYRDEVYTQDSPDRGTAEILVAKHRNGPTGKVHLAFLEHLTKFENMARVD
jgi:replicative DNA helicase